MGAKPADLALLRPLIDAAASKGGIITARVGSGAEAETIHALPLTGYENNLAAVLLIASSRRVLVEMEASLSPAQASHP